MKFSRAVRCTFVCAAAAIIGTVLGMRGLTIDDPMFWVIDAALVLLIIAS